MVEIKKFVTSEERKRRRTRNYIIIVVVLIAVMLISPAGYTLFNNGDSTEKEVNYIKYNGVDFLKNENGYWQFSKNNYIFVTKYNPTDLNDTIVKTGLYITNYQNQVVYLDWNSSQEGAYELSRNFQYNSIPERMTRACLSINCSGDFPVKNCSNDKIISFRLPENNEKERVYTNENCVFVVTNSSNQIKYIDAFLFDILGI